MDFLKFWGTPLIFRCSKLVAASSASTQKCLTCHNYYDSKRELRAHLVQDKKHIKPKEQIKARMREFRARVAKKYGTNPDATIDTAALSPGETKTFISICLEHVYMIHLRRN